MDKKTANAIGLYMEGIADGNAAQAVEKYTGAVYKQHSTGVSDDKEGFLTFFADFLKRNPIRDIQVIRALQDGQYVFLHVLQTLGGGETMWVTADFFDTDENDKMIEHWDVISQFCAATPSDRTNIDGATQIADLDKTQSNKQLVRDFITNILCAKQQGNIEDYISSETYIQHNASMPDGLAHFKSLVLAPNNPLTYQEIVLLVGQGNFVATLCKTSWDGEPYAHADIFRLQNDLIVEHWDVAEPVPPKEEWTNSGKF